MPPQRPISDKSEGPIPISSRKSMTFKSMRFETTLLSMLRETTWSPGVRALGSTVPKIVQALQHQQSYYTDYSRSQLSSCKMP